MKSLHTPVRPSEFLLDSDANPAGDLELALLHARGVFFARLKRIIWTAAMDEGPSADESIACIQNLVAPTIGIPETEKLAEFANNISIAARYGEKLELSRRYAEAVATIRKRGAHDAHV